MSEILPVWTNNASSSIKTANIQPAGAALLDLTLLMIMHCVPNVSVKCCQFMFLEFLKQSQSNPASQILKDLAFEAQFLRNWGV